MEQHSTARKASSSSAKARLSCPIREEDRLDAVELLRRGALQQQLDYLLSRS
jgi:hypothetical protein